MKNIILLLTLLSLFACDKCINEDVYIEAVNTIPPDTNQGSSPKGIYIEYLSDSMIYDYCAYVGKTYMVRAVSGQRCYAKVTSEHWCKVSVITKDGKILFEDKGYQVALIDELY